MPLVRIARLVTTATIAVCFAAADSRAQGPSPDAKVVPECVECPSPVLPPQLARKRDAKVMLRTVINTEGRCEDIAVVRSVSAELDRLAVEAAQKWKFKPFLGPDGKPFPLRLMIEVVFRDVDEKVVADAELNDFVERIKIAIRKKIDKQPLRVLLFPSAIRERIATALGRDAGIKVIDGQQFTQLYEREGLEPAHFKSGKVIAWAATALDADVALLSEVSLKSKDVNVRVMAIDASNGSKVGDVKAKLSKTAELAKVISDWQAPSPPLVQLAPTVLPSGEKAHTAGRDNTSVPRCRYCPNPQFSQPAIDLRIEGTVVLKVLVGADGRLSQVKPVKGQPFGLTARAIEAVKHWELEPAKKGGVPVPVWMLVEVIFRQH